MSNILEEFDLIIDLGYTEEETTVNDNEKIDE